MAHIEPRPRAEVGELQEIFAGAEAAMGFVPNSMLTMAHMPQLPAAFFALTSVVFGGDLKAAMPMLERSVANDSDRRDNLPPDLVQLIAFAVSVAAGCRYCQAHTSHSAAKRGVSVEKINAAFEFETSDLFDEAERAALRVALHAGMVPNAVEPTHMTALNEHYTARQCVEIVAVISLFGYLNRWNDTMASTLEDKPVSFASTNLPSWEIGKHA